MALGIAAATHYIGKVLVQHFDVIHKIVEPATVFKPVPSLHTMVFDFDLPALHLSLLQERDQAVLVIPVIVERN